MPESKSKNKKEGMDQVSMISKYIDELNKKNKLLKTRLEKLTKANESTKQKIEEISLSAQNLRVLIEQASNQQPAQEEDSAPTTPNIPTHSSETTKPQRVRRERVKTINTDLEIDAPVTEARIFNNPRKGTPLSTPINDERFQRLNVGDQEEIEEEETLSADEPETEKGLILAKRDLPSFKEITEADSKPKFNINPEKESALAENPDKTESAYPDPSTLESTEKANLYPLVVTNSNELNKADIKVVDTAVAEIFHEYEEVLDGQIVRETKIKKPTVGQKVAWLKNKIVNAVGGIGSKIKDKIISESAKSLMRKGVMVFTFTSAFANSTSGNLREYSNEGIKVNLENTAIDYKEYLIENGVDLAIYDSLTTQAKEIYLKHCTGEWSFDEKSKDNSLYNPYIIIDKPTAKEYVFDGDNKLIACFPIIRGSALGEGPNIADPSSDRPGAHATSPMGEYEFFYSEKIVDFSSYDGRMFQIVSEGKFKRGNWLMHETYKGELKERTAALNSETPTDNNMSWGCINADASVFDQYLLPTFGDGERYKIFITADDTSTEFVP